MRSRKVMLLGESRERGEDDGECGNSVQVAVLFYLDDCGSGFLATNYFLLATSRWPSFLPLTGTQDGGKDAANRWMTGLSSA